MQFEILNHVDCLSDCIICWCSSSAS